MSGVGSPISAHPSVVLGRTDAPPPSTTGQLGDYTVTSEKPGHSRRAERFMGGDAPIDGSAPKGYTSIKDRMVKDAAPTKRSGTTGSSTGVPEKTDGSKESAKTFLKDLAKRDPSSISRSQVTDAMGDIQSDSTLAKLKEKQNPSGFLDKVADFFSSGRFLKLLPKAIGGPIWSLIQESRANRNSERMTKIGHDAGEHAQTKGSEASHSLPRELAMAMAGHYQHKAEKLGDQAMIGTAGMVASPMLGALFAPAATAIGGTVGALVGQGLSTGTGMAGKIGAEQGISVPHRDAQHLQSTAHEVGSTVPLGGGETANSVKTARAFLKFLGMPPREDMLTSPDAGTRKQEESRLLLKRSMGGDINTDYNKEVRTERDQLEKMASSGRDTSPGAFDGASVISGAGVEWDGQYSGDYLRRMMVSEGIISHSIESEMAKERCVG